MNRILNKKRHQLIQEDFDAIVTALYEAKTGEERREAGKALSRLFRLASLADQVLMSTEVCGDPYDDEEE